jgi:hypothetical protein
MAWQPVENPIIRDEAFRKTILETGYLTAGNIGRERVEALLTLFSETHELKNSEGGTFYTLFSKRLDYRQDVHLKIQNTLKEVFDRLLVDYKITVNSFIVKLPGPKSSFALHQDSTGLDEYRYSPLSLWIPLQKTDITNGTLCVVPKSHKLFYPYRGITIPAPYAEYEVVLRKYLVPLSFEAGDILMFDNRMVHYSHTNTTAQPRIVALSGAFHKNAGIETCFMDKNNPAREVEVYSQPDDYVLSNRSFLDGQHERPTTGKLLKKVQNVDFMCHSVYDFLSWAKRNQLEETNISELCKMDAPMNSFAEPTGS